MNLVMSGLLLMSLLACVKKGEEIKEGNVVANSWSWNTPQKSTLNLSKEMDTIAGYYFGALTSLDGIGTYALFYNPVGITTDKYYLYVSDAAAIRKINKASLEVTTITGVFDSVGSYVDGVKALARLDTPIGMAVVGNDLYVTDIQNTIRKIDISTGAVSTIAGAAGATGSTNGHGSIARFNDPRGLITDGTYLYIADSGNNMIRKLHLASNEVTTIAGATPTGNVDGTGANARFDFPMNITSDGTYIYVVDNGNKSIRRVTIATGQVITFAGSSIGEAGSTDGRGQSARFKGIYNITSDASYLYVTDWIDCTIRKISKSTADVSTIGGAAGQCPDIIEGPYGTNRMMGATGIVADEHALYFVDALTVRRMQ